MKRKVIVFVKRELVFVIAFLLALGSSFYVRQVDHYLEYIDFRVIVLLFCLMGTIAGFNKIGIFEQLGKKLLTSLTNTRQLYWVFILLTFFSSMFITNDVSLLTFVPFTIMVLTMAKLKDLMIYFIVMETIAANLGSMLTPIGNPQNLYLYTVSHMSLMDFLQVTFPVSILSLVLLLLSGFFVKKKEIARVIKFNTDRNGKIKSRLNKMILLYSVLFLLCILTVIRILPYQILFLIVLLVIFVMDKKNLMNIDYFLLLTFICFFIFIGNVGNIPYIYHSLAKIMTGNELVLGIVTSQFISNVPAAILLSTFTKEYSLLLLGVNVGGLGTIVASLASLISYKIYMQTMEPKSGAFLGTFTKMNLLFLIVIMGVIWLL